jgi:hypothetical protein
MTVITQPNGFGRRRLTRLLPPMRPPSSSSWSTLVAPWIFDQKRLSGRHTGPATRLSLHLLEARCSANRSAQTFGLSTITTLALPDPLHAKSVFCSPVLPSPALGASASSIPPQNPLLVLRPSIRNAVFNGQFTATARSREPSIQHDYPSHALPRNDAPPCHVSCLRPGNAPRLRSPLLTSLTGSATLPFRTRLRLAGHRLTPVPVHPPA